MSIPDKAAARVFRRQCGVITASQAIRAGVSRHEIETRVNSGRWHRFARGVFILAGAPTTFEQRVMAACLTAGDGAVASHATARHFLAPGRFSPPKRIDLTVGIGQSARALDVLDVSVHRTRHLSPRDIVRVGYVPVTKPARLLADMAAGSTPAELDDLVDEILCRYPRLAPATVRPSNRNLTRALAPWLDGPRPESVPEMALQRRLTEAGLPTPVRQFVIADPNTGEFVARVDLAYPDIRLAIEYDGARTHGPRQAEHDGRRRAGIAAAGWLTLTARSRDADRSTCDEFVAAVKAAREAAVKASREGNAMRRPPPVRSPRATTRRAAS